MKQLPLLGTVLLFLLTAASVQASSSFNVSYGESFGCGGIAAGGTAVDSTGNLYVCGGFDTACNFDPAGGAAGALTSAGGRDAYIVKYSPTGALIWARRVGGTGSDVANDVALDGAGNVYVTGFFQNTADFDPGAGTFNLTATGTLGAFVLKLSPSGSFLWAKAFTADNIVSADRLKLDTSGNIFVGGHFTGTADFDPSAASHTLTSVGGSMDVFVTKLDAAGNFVWAKSIGGSSVETVNGMALDAAGNIYLSGAFFGTTNFDPNGTHNLTSYGSYDAYILKLNASGAYVWANQIGAANIDLGRGVAVDSSGNVFVTGVFAGTAKFDTAGTLTLTEQGGNDAFLVKYGSTGSALWAKDIGGTLSDSSNDLALDASGNLYVSGTFGGTVDFDQGSGTANLTSTSTSDSYLVTYDANGNYIAAVAILGQSPSTPRSIVLDSSGAIILSGFSQSPVIVNATPIPAPGAQNEYIVKFTLGQPPPPPPPGNFAIGVTGNGITPGKVAVDANGNSYVCGTFSGTYVFDPINNSASLTSAGGSDVFVVEDAPSGTALWAKRVGGGGDDLGQGIAVDGSGNVYVTGSFQNSVDFDPGAGTATLTSNGSNDIFVLKLDPAGNYLWARGIGGVNADTGNRIAVDASGNVYCAGTFQGTVDFDPSSGVSSLTSNGGALNVFLLKLNSAGQFIWARGYGGSTGTFINGLTLDGAGNAYLAGPAFGPATFGSITVPNAGSYDVYLAKVTPAGSVVWAESIGGTGVDMGRGIAADVAGNIYVTGIFTGAVDFDPSAGANVLTSANGQFDAFVARYTTNGALVWTRGIISPTSTSTTDLAIDSSGNPMVIGLYSGTLTLGSGSSAVTVTSAGGTDAFMAKYSYSGAVLGLETVGGVNNDLSASIAVDPNGFVTGVGGYLKSPAVFRGSVLPNGAANMFVVRFQFKTPMLQPPALLSQASALPNPATAGTAVSFTVGASDPAGATLTYTWNFGDGAQGSGASVTHTYVAAGTYSVSVSISNGITAPVKSTVSLTVSAAPPPPPPPPPAPPASGGTGTTVTGGTGSGTDTGVGATPVPPTLVPFSASKLMGTLKLKLTGHDSLSVSGTLPGFTAATTVSGNIDVVVNGIVFQFAAGGSGPAKYQKSTLLFAAKKNAKAHTLTYSGAFKLSLKNVDLSALRAAFTATGAAITGLTIDLIMNGNAYETGYFGPAKVSAQGLTFKH